MIENPALCDWQLRDPFTNLVYPWWTWDFLKQLQSWDLSQCNILEYGGGYSSIWLAKHAKQVLTIETSSKWVDSIVEMAYAAQLDNLTVITREFNEGDQSVIEQYLSVPDSFRPDIVCVDGILRNECLQRGIKLLSEGEGGILIADNIDQDFVWRSPGIWEITKGYEFHRFFQKEHTNHEGNPWNTGYWVIPKK